ncbi:MAG: glycosyltransferase family A protein [Candidatus Thorarchaeota archaeon]
MARITIPILHRAVFMRENEMLADSSKALNYVDALCLGKSDLFDFLPKQSTDFLQKLVPDRVSVIVPVYNAEKTLMRCLTSLVDQSYPNLEILVVDDRSSDASFNKAFEFINHIRDRRFRLFQTNLNSGPYAIKNLLLREHITGEFITFLD